MICDWFVAVVTMISHQTLILVKISQVVPVFFVRKKNRKKWIVQNYKYLNEWTVKNNYPLPLISDIVENIGTKKIFTKMDL